MAALQDGNKQEACLGAYLPPLAAVTQVWGSETWVSLEGSGRREGDDVMKGFDGVMGKDGRRLDAEQEG